MPILLKPIGPIVVAEPPAVFIPGTSGNDWLNGTIYNDVMHGYGGYDYLDGGAGNDAIYGEEESDWLFGGAGNDVLDGGTGDDWLYGGTGDDSLRGGNQNDVLDGGAGADTLAGGDGFDTVSYASATLGVTIDLNRDVGGVSNDAQGDYYVGIEKFVGSSYGDIMLGNVEANNLEGGAGDDWLFGYGNRDELSGGAGSDYIDGGDSDDLLFGGAGQDMLVGGQGIDWLDGGAGQDILTGGEGADTFVLTANSGGPDKITDFDGTIDQLAFSGFGATPFGSDGKLAYGHFDGGLFGDGWVTRNLDASDKVFYDVDTGWLIEMTPDLAYAMTHDYAISMDYSQIGVAELGGQPYLADFLVV